MINRYAIRLVCIFCTLLAGGTFAAEKEKPSTAGRPRVLIIGDSISIGYTEQVRKNLADIADVSRPNDNCQHTAYGLAHIDAWLGQEKWDVIHFNWGIWDTHMVDDQGQIVRDDAKAEGKVHMRHTPEQYRENLTALVKKMKATGAKLVWASTTPIMSRTGKRFEDIANLNKVALEVMRGNDVAIIDDLYEFVLPHAGEWQAGDRVHFADKGNQALGQHVSERIRVALKSSGRQKQQ